MVRPGRVGHRQWEAAAGTLAGRDRRDDLQPDRIAQRLEHRRQLEIAGGRHGEIGPIAHSKIVEINAAPAPLIPSTVVEFIAGGRMRKTLIGAALGTTTGLAWGGQFVIGKSAVDRVDAFHLTTVRYALAGLVLLAILAAVEGLAALRGGGRGLRP